jgi:hypothetical protein
LCCSEEESSKNIILSIIFKSEQKIGWNGSKYISTKKSIKLVGINRTLKFCGWNFRKLTEQESRDISLDSILHGKEPNIIKTKDINKLDLLANKDFELISCLAKSIIDPNRHHLSIVEWACEKLNGHLPLKPSDYSSLLEMSLKDILEKIETK